MYHILKHCTCQKDLLKTHFSLIFLHHALISIRRQKLLRSQSNLRINNISGCLHMNMQYHKLTIALLFFIKYQNTFFHLNLCDNEILIKICKSTVSNDIHFEYDSKKTKLLQIWLVLNTKSKT